MFAKGVGFWKGAGIPKGRRAVTFFECGCCSCYHRTDFDGDCREDSERFHEIPVGGREVFLDTDDEEAAKVEQARGAIDNGRR